MPWFWHFSGMKQKTNWMSVWPRMENTGKKHMQKTSAKNISKPTCIQPPVFYFPSFFQHLTSTQKLATVPNLGMREWGAAMIQTTRLLECKVWKVHHKDNGPIGNPVSMPCLNDCSASTSTDPVEALRAIQPIKAFLTSEVASPCMSTVNPCSGTKNTEWDTANCKGSLPPIEQLF